MLKALERRINIVIRTYKTDIIMVLSRIELSVGNE